MQATFSLFCSYCPSAYKAGLWNQSPTILDDRSWSWIQKLLDGGAETGARAWNLVSSSRALVSAVWHQGFSKVIAHVLLPIKNLSQHVIYADVIIH